MHYVVLTGKRLFKHIEGQILVKVNPQGTPFMGQVYMESILMCRHGVNGQWAYCLSHASPSQWHRTRFKQHRYSKWTKIVWHFSPSSHLKNLTPSHHHVLPQSMIFISMQDLLVKSCQHARAGKTLLLLGMTCIAHQGPTGIVHTALKCNKRVLQCKTSRAQKPVSRACQVKIIAP